MSHDDRPPRTAGSPSNPELAERLARVEEKQDHVVEQIDRVAETLDEELADVEETQAALLERNRKMWLAFQAAKYLGGPAGLIALGVTLAL